MHTFSRKPRANQRTMFAKSAAPGQSHTTHKLEVNSILHLRRMIGNQATRRLLEKNAEDIKGDSAAADFTRFGRNPSQISIHNARLPSSARRTLEPRLGHSLASIRIHADDAAAARASRRGAVAFAAGRHIYLGAGAYQPNTPVGDWILAHEGTHAAQQGFANVSEAALPNAADPALEAQANRVASGQSARIDPCHAPAAMALTPAQFQTQLGSTPEQTLSINTLFSNASFSGVWNWLGSCAATPAKDLGPVALKVSPGLLRRGIERFGGYSSLSRTLEINPTKSEHVDNPAEMVDTVFHETIHAADDLNSTCQTAGSAPAPLAGAATSVLPSRSSVASDFSGDLV